MFLFWVVGLSCRPHLLTSMARTIQAPLRVKSVGDIGDTTRVVASPDDFHDETDESELSEDSDQFSDEGSDYGSCA